MNADKRGPARLWLLASHLSLIISLPPMNGDNSLVGCAVHTILGKARPERPCRQSLPLMSLRAQRGNFLPRPPARYPKRQAVRPGGG